MTDFVRLIVKGGKGGDGKVSFRREKYVPKGGPDGGDGGDGGSVYLEADQQLASLKHLSGAKNIEAKAGASGGKRQKTGAASEDVTIKVPVGTRVWLLREQLPPEGWQRRSLEPLRRDQVKFYQYQVEWNKPGQRIEDDQTDTQPAAWPWQKEEKTLLVELTQPGQKVLLAQGGFGGKGNTRFKSSRLTTPWIAESGTLGETREVIFELRLLADVGLVGLPSVGKSTLLSVLTSARPKIAAYPFTTLEPQLGVLAGDAKDGKELVLADLPGIIEGASTGKGLGQQFLRHIEHCAGLVVVLAPDPSLWVEQLPVAKQLADQLQAQLDQVLAELKAYPEPLTAKSRLVVVNKIDLLSPSVELSEIKLKNVKPIFVSAVTGRGLEQLVSDLRQLVG